MTLEEGLKNSTPFCTTECVEGVPLSWDQTRVKLMNSKCWNAITHYSTGQKPKQQQ